MKTRGGKVKKGQPGGASCKEEEKGRGISWEVNAKTTKERGKPAKESEGEEEKNENEKWVDKCIRRQVRREETLHE